MIAIIKIVIMENIKSYYHKYQEACQWKVKRHCYDN